MMKGLSKSYSEKGVRVLDAPVSGGTIGAEQVTLTLMIGGNQYDFEEVKPVLNAVGKNFIVVGPQVQVNGSWMFANKLKSVAEGQFEPGFKMNLLKKDICIAIKAGEGISIPVHPLLFNYTKWHICIVGKKIFHR